MMAALPLMVLCAALAGTDVAPVATVSPLGPQGATPPAAAAPASGWLDEPVSAQPKQVRSRAGIVACVLCGSGALLGIFALGVRRGAGRKKDLSHGRSIELLALRPLGGKQRLALVSVCGERLLLAANDREVTLLSHLPAAEPQAEAEVAPANRVAMPSITQPDLAAAVAVPASVMAPAPEPATVAAMEAALYAADAAAAAPKTSSMNQDLAGLHAWRREMQAAEGRA